MSLLGRSATVARCRAAADRVRPVSDTRPRHIDRRQSWRLIHSSSTSMKVSRDFGIVVRRAALAAKNVER
ncbi:hypothetical protein BGL_1c17580 [Burkholderia plantarii]|uniref:Uncharacterized protein n=1 Tax=Burkholderia plantarii TaxID=41899 RepID=A0A0B6RLS2_BURPL|nr:hypothetical protein BGL_1c17580 [Burkholderia plantarii]